MKKIMLFVSLFGVLLITGCTVERVFSTNIILAETFEEVLEAITWRQLGLFGGKVVIYNSYGYYDNMIQMFNKATEDGFMNVGVDFFTVANNIDELASIIEK